MKKSAEFRFDPFTVILQCFHTMFPRKRAIIEWTENLHIEDQAWGKTDIISKTPASVLIDTSQTVVGSIDTLIHELAHVGRGYPSHKGIHQKIYVKTGGHDKQWLIVYNDLWKNYEKHYLTYLFRDRIGCPKGISKDELFRLMSAVVDKSFENQITKKDRRKKRVKAKASSR